MSCSPYEKKVEVNKYAISLELDLAFEFLLLEKAKLLATFLVNLFLVGKGGHFSYLMA